MEEEEALQSWNTALGGRPPENGRDDSSQDDESYVYSPDNGQEEDGGEEDDDDDDDDDDEDYQDAEEDHEEDEEGAEGEDGDIGADNLPGEVEIIIRGAGDAEDDRNVEDMIMTQRITGLLRTSAGIRVLTEDELLTLIQTRDLGNVLVGGHDDTELEDDFLGWPPARRRRPTPDPNRFPKVPSEEGAKLMHSGEFGADEHPSETRVQKSLAMRMLNRELGLGDIAERRRNEYLIAQGMVPSTKPEMIIQYDCPVYSGQFSDDGNFFFSCGQDFLVRMYDTSNPHAWKHYKTVRYPRDHWTLTDASLSPDNRWLAYTSIHSEVCLAPTNPDDKGDPYALDLAGTGRRGSYRALDAFGIWSVRFSGDGRELVAGTNAHSVVVYDIESCQVLHNVVGHKDDVNAVCFADSSSPNMFYSGSDDSTIKVWDRRDLAHGREVGAFVGHIEGITYIDSKNDGRYLLSNGKDQNMKLWDARMMMSSEGFRKLKIQRDPSFDYRWGTFRESDWYHDPNDNSVVTFRGHKVLRTLIRCHFSPPHSTHSRYVYSGSQDGKVYIWNLDATLKETIDVRKATMGSRQPLRRRRRHFWAHDDGDEADIWETCVRDASWHPNAPMLVATSFNGYGREYGTCSVHSFDDNAEEEEMSDDEDDDQPRTGISFDEKMNPYVQNRWMSAR